ncbi:hypothetical protein PQZ39_00215 [bacterium]|nr:hypothetical protein [bacterium]
MVNNVPGHNPDLSKYSKVKQLTPQKNLYVNPSWNLGIKQAENELVCLLSDDINFNVDVLFNFVFQTSNLLGVFGLNVHSDFEIPYLTLGHNIGRGWGSALFLKKSNYTPVPPQLKIWYGDNWICNTHFPYSYTIHYKVDAELEVSSSSTDLHPIIEQDINEWKKLRI